MNWTQHELNLIDSHQDLIEKRDLVGLLRAFSIGSEIISERDAEYTLPQTRLLKKILTEIIYNFAITRGKKGLVMP